MLAASVFVNPAVVGLIIALPSATLGYLGYRQAQKVDKVAEQAGIATVESGTIKQVIDGLNELVKSLQADNRSLREVVSVVEVKLAAVIRECEGLKLQIAELNRRP